MTDELKFKLTLGRVMRKIRRNNKMKVEDKELMKVVSYGTVNNLESGRYAPNIYNFVRVCEVYGVDAPNVLSTVMAELNRKL